MILLIFAISDNQKEMLVEKFPESFTFAVLMIPICIAPGCKHPKLFIRYSCIKNHCKIIETFTVDFAFVQKIGNLKAIE